MLKLLLFCAVGDDGHRRIDGVVTIEKIAQLVWMGDALDGADF